MGTSWEREVYLFFEGLCLFSLSVLSVSSFPQWEFIRINCAWNDSNNSDYHVLRMFQSILNGRVAFHVPSFPVVRVVSFSVFYNGSMYQSAVHNGCFQINTAHRLQWFAKQPRNCFGQSIYPGLLSKLNCLSRVVVRHLQSDCSSKEFQPAIAIRCISGLQRLLLVFLTVDFQTWRPRLFSNGNSRRSNSLKFNSQRYRRANHFRRKDGPYTAISTTYAHVGNVWISTSSSLLIQMLTAPCQYRRIIVFG